MRTGNSRFQELLGRVGEVEEKSLAENSHKQYESCLRVYERTVKEAFDMDPYPMTIEKIQAFILDRHENQRKFSTLQNYLHAFSYHFRTAGLPNLTVSVELKRFRVGLKRMLTGACFPYQKQPFEFSWFAKLAEVMDLATFDDRLFFFVMSLAYHFFMRVSEILSLRPQDIVLNPNNETLSVNFWKTKTDQFGRGTVSYIRVTGDVSCPSRYLDVVRRLPQNEPIYSLKAESLNSKLRARLGQIGVEKVNEYSFHSFRRGGAFRASEKGVQDCVIKKHGRWRSEAYMRYVRVDAVRAGAEVTAAFRAE